MIKSKLLVSCAFAAILVLAVAPAWADNIPVTNASFEAFNTLIYSSSAGSWNIGPIPGWTTTGVTGSFQPSSSEFSSIPGGSIVAFTNGGSISQDLGVGLAANTSYTLSVFVGDRLDGANGNYTIALDAGSTTLCTFSGNSASITPGTWMDETCNYQSGSILTPGDLSVVFSSQGTQLDIDKVSVATPEPGSLALLAVGLLSLCVVLRRKAPLQFSAC